MIIKLGYQVIKEKSNSHIEIGIRQMCCGGTRRGKGNWPFLLGTQYSPRELEAHLDALQEMINKDIERIRRDGVKALKQAIHRSKKT